MELNDIKAEYNEALERMTALGAEVDSADAESFDGVNARFVEAETEVRTLGARIESMEKVSEARAAHKPAAIAATPAIRVGAQPLMYEERGEHNFLADVVAAHKRDSAAGERLARHTEEMRTSSQTTTGAGTGAELVVPIYMQSAYVKNTAAGVFMGLFQDKGAPQTNSFNIPKITGTSAAVHTENAAVSQTDATTSTVNVLTKSVFAGQTLSVEQVELGIPGLTDAYYQALTKQHDIVLDGEFFTANATGRKGVLNLSSTGNNVTSSAGSFTGAKFLVLVQKAISKVQTVAFGLPNIVVMHPRRIAWLASEVDLNGRPLLTLDAGWGSQDVGAFGALSNLAPSGFRGYLAGTGLAVFADANIPTTQGASTNEDIVVVADNSYLWKWQSPLRVKASDATLADTGGIFLYLYSLAGFTMQVQDGAVSWISGSDLAAPSGF